MNKSIARMPASPSVKDEKQGTFDLTVDRHTESDGIGMGVLSDGTPFLNQRGVARLCGVENRYIGVIGTEWAADSKSERTSSVRRIMSSHGNLLNEVAVETMYGKRRMMAYPEIFCMAVLEYYAFEANLAGAPIARESYRKLAAHGLRKFIYQEVGYDADQQVDVWKVFRDRVSLTYDAVPTGYFSVFKELSSTIVTLGLEGLHIDEKFVPDISVGQAWSNYWRTKELSKVFGERASYPHSYPAYFPQSASNPQISRCYPEDALGEFRRWFRNEYIGEGKFKKYLSKKVGEKLLPEGYVERAMLALTKP